MTLGHTHIAYLDVHDIGEVLFTYSVPELALRAGGQRGQMLALGHGVHRGRLRLGHRMALRRGWTPRRLVGPGSPRVAGT